MTEQRRGFLLGVAAYAMWGGVALYWPLLEPAGAVEILAHRVLWSVLAMGALVLVLRRLPAFVALVRDRRARRVLTLAAVVIAGNWGLYIWGVNSGHVIETALGYFINPLVTVVLGVVVLGERLRRAQWVAIGIATLAVVVLTVDYGRLPWIALVLALSFATYGLCKKQASAGAIESLAWETLVLTPLAIGYLVWLGAAGTFQSGGPGHAMLLASTGIVTAVPLICFGAAAVRLPMVTLGLLQYLAPTLQFLSGLLVFREAMPASRWIGFGLVWLALVVITAESLRFRRRALAGVPPD